MADKVAPGARVKTNPLFNDSGTINDVLDMLGRHRRDALGRPGQRKQHTPSTDVVYVKNLTGGDRALGDVVQLGDYMLDDINQDNLWFEGNLPALPLGKIAILREPAKVDDIVRASVSGVWIANVDVTDVVHGFAFPQDNLAVLMSGEGGAIELLSVPTGTGEQLIPVRFIYRSAFYVGKTTSTISAMTDGPPPVPGSGTVQVYYKNSAGELELVTDMVFTSLNLAAETIASETWVMIAEDGFGKLWIHYERCSM